MQRMSIVFTNTCCLGRLSFLFTNPPFSFLTSFRVSSLEAGLFKVSALIFYKLHDSISESRYYTSTDRTMLQAFLM